MDNAALLLSASRPSPGAFKICSNPAKSAAAALCTASLIFSSGQVKQLDLIPAEPPVNSCLSFVKNSLSPSCFAYNSFIISKGREAMNTGIRPSQSENLKRLDSFLTLAPNWNHNGAKAIEPALAARAKGLLLNLIVQPEIFPTADGSIQFEYDNANGAHFDFEIYGDNTAEYLWVDKDGLSFEDEGVLNLEKINEAIRALYRD